MYRIVQEALTNIAKHAGATSISILADTRRSAPSCVVVEDDGTGFDDARSDAMGSASSGMRERVALVGGRLRVETSPGAGTTIAAEVPLRDASAFSSSTTTPSSARACGASSTPRTDIETVGGGRQRRACRLRGARAQARRRADGRRHAREERHRGHCPRSCRRVPDVRVLVLSMQDDPRYVREAFEAGASGYVLKEAADTDVVEAVRAVAAGERYVHPALGARLVAAETEERKRAESDPLSEREREVLRLLALGHTNQEIAALLYISVRTAETHRAHIMQKLGLSSRAELVRYALDHGLIDR